MGSQVSLAHLFLHRGRLLESGGGRNLRLHDQPTDRPLLHARPNTTPVHANAAFFGVYGMLGLGLTLMCLRALQAEREWKEGLLRFSFWAMNARPDVDDRAEPAPIRTSADCGLSSSTATGMPAAASSSARASCRPCAGCGCQGTRSSRSARSGSWSSSSGLALDILLRINDGRRPGHVDEWKSRRLRDCRGPCRVCRRK
jgi:hypothetical protein